MLWLFFFLSYYRSRFNISSNSCFTSFPLLNFGFKKNAYYSIKISNLTSQMIFGLATKKEIKKIKSMKDDIQVHKALSNVQYIVSNETEINGKIVSKGVLTPFSYSCNRNYKFEINLSYKNIHNHLDSRCQSMMICTMFFSVLFIVIEVCFVLYWHFYEKCKRKFHFYIDSFIIIIAIINIASFLLFNFSKNNEYFVSLFAEDTINNSAQTSIKILISFLYLISLLIISMIIFHFYRVETFSDFSLYNFLSMLLFLALSFICLILIVTVHVIDKNNLLFIFPLGFYILYCLIQFNFLTSFSLTKIAALFYIFGNAFTFALRSTFLNQSSSVINTNVALIIMTSISIVIQMITVAMLLFGYIHYHDQTIAETSNGLVFQTQKSYTNIL